MLFTGLGRFVLGKTVPSSTVFPNMNLPARILIRNMISAQLTKQYLVDDKSQTSKIYTKISTSLIEDHVNVLQSPVL